MRKLPPLTALRAFEAAARLENFSRAAADLNVTHAAVIQQVRQLEDWFGQKLFRKEGRGVMLTDAGLSLSRDVSQAFDQMEEATRRTLGLEAERPIQVTSTAVFASRWLIPRLARFHAAHPGIRIRLDSSATLMDYGRENIDIGVRYGNGQWKDLESLLLIPGQRAPMCSPELLKAGPPLEEVEDILNYPLIHDVDHSEWGHWFLEHGIDYADLEQGTVHTMSMLAYQAAIEGHGLFLGVENMVREDIEAGRLVMPLGDGGKEGGGYFLVTRQERELRPTVKLFRDWILAEAQLEKA